MPGRNPFPVDRFVGRRDELSALVSLVADHGQSRTIVGEPRIGKTALLQHLASTALTADPSPCAPRLHLSPLNAHTFDAAFDHTAFWTEALDPLESAGLFAATDTPLGAAYRRCQERAFSTTALQRLLKALGAARHRLVVLVDEFDYLVHRHIARHSEFFAGLRALTIDPSRALALVTASRTPLKLLNKLAAQHGFGGSPYFNAGAEILLGAFSDSDVEDLLLAAGDTFSPDDRRFVQTLSGGYPHLVQTAAAALFGATDPDPARRRLIAGLALRREASATLDDIWNHWPSTNRQVFAAVAVEHLDTFGTRVAWAPALVPIADPATYPEEVDALEKHGFIARSPHTRSGYAVRPLVFLAWCAAKLRGHAQSAPDWARWMETEGWSGARQRDLWEKVIRPRAAGVSTDLETLLAAHDALSQPTAAPPPSVSRFEPRPPRKVRLFYSHAAPDSDHVHRLEAHLALLKRDGLLETWSSRDIGAGEEWRRSASDALESADLIVLLVSADFLASDYLWGTELARAKERLEKGGVRLLSIRLRPADWGSFWPGGLDVLPADGRAVTAWPDADTAWADVAVGIRKIVEEIADVLGAR